MNESGLARSQGGRRLVAKFDQRLSELIAAHYPDKRHRPGYAKLATQVGETTGGTISATCLWELATGKERNASLEQLDVPAEFFEVPPEYFFDDAAAERITSELRLATALRDTQVRNLASHADGLPPEALDALLTAASRSARATDTSSWPPTATSPRTSSSTPRISATSTGAGTASRSPRPARPVTSP
ncbi:hypothetical protein [Streptomyces sp. x-80]|uniref:hypothetical protein n=1 Tax=Streptomyces sp. x-80 TaxID=2789282 RepID=UPI00397FEF5D